MDPLNLQKAQQQSRVTGFPLSQILVEENFCEDKALNKLMSEHMGVAYVDLEVTEITPELLTLLPESLCRKYQALPISLERNKLIVAMADPMNIYALEDIRFITDLDIEVRLASSLQIKNNLNKLFNQKSIFKKQGRGKSSQVVLPPVPQTQPQDHEEELFLVDQTIGQISTDPTEEDGLLNIEEVVRPQTPQSEQHQDYLAHVQVKETFRKLFQETGLSENATNAAPEKKINDLIEKQAAAQQLIWQPPSTQSTDNFEQRMQRLNARPDSEVNQQGQIRAKIKLSPEQKSQIVGSKDNSPAVKWVNQFLIQAIETQATDIHFEPYSTYYRVRMRIDGNLVEVARPEMSLLESINVRLKVLAGLDIIEKRLPQDGRLKLEITGLKNIDFRVSTLPIAHGEKIVLRLLNHDSLFLNLEQIGFGDEDLNLLKSQLNKPNGCILVTGPTGSGKTTTLYSALNEINSPEVNIITVEDPVEYQIPGINQVQVNEAVELNFSMLLRHFLRQDPDVVLVGEIRDFETADITLKAAMTGHLVLSTLHTHSAVSSIIRLTQMGVAAHNITASVNCILSQRLVKRLCDHCKVEDKSVTPSDLLALGIPESYHRHFTPQKNSGCEQCNQTGIKGRLLVHELLILSPQLKQAILDQPDLNSLEQIVNESGMISIKDRLLRRFMQGLVSYKELLRHFHSDLN